jgi:hypothetical protein
VGSDLVQTTGSGLSDLTLSGIFYGGADAFCQIKINTAAVPDTFKVSFDGGATWSGALNCATTAVSIGNGMFVTFNASTGHTANDIWSFTLHITDSPSSFFDEYDLEYPLAWATYKATTESSVMAKMTGLITDSLAKFKERRTGRNLGPALSMR